MFWVINLNPPKHFNYKPVNYFSMSTTIDLSPEKQQDHFILSFLVWLAKNFKQTGDDEYLDVSVAVLPQNKLVFRTAAECLAQYRKQQIPQLPPLFGHSDNETSAIAEAKRQNKALFCGYEKIQSTLALNNEPLIFKQTIRDIIIETMDQIS